MWTLFGTHSKTVKNRYRPNRPVPLTFGYNILSIHCLLCKHVHCIACTGEHLAVSHGIQEFLIVMRKVFSWHILADINPCPAE